MTKKDLHDDYGNFLFQYIITPTHLCTLLYNLNEETVNSIRINKANSGCEKLVYFRICDAFGSKLKSYSSSSLRNHREGLLVRSKLSF